MVTARASHAMTPSELRTTGNSRWRIERPLDQFSKPKGEVVLTCINVEAIQREIAAGYISDQVHGHAPLRILNYTQRAQFDWHWTTETRQCRGLIVDHDWNVVARPFEKFFSVEQLNGCVPVEPFEAYEKMDGSLGILYFLDEKPQIATRGSFVSEQAQRATKMLAEKYGDAQLNPEFTYLFEIIYPENRIVIDYGPREELVLLAIIETQTGVEWPLDAYDSVFPVVKRYDWFSDFNQLLRQQEKDREGFVVRFQCGQRVKIKFAEYKRLHKLLTGLSPKAIWEILRAGGSIDEFLERVPDEFYQWIRETENDLRCGYANIEARARGYMKFGDTRKELAEWYKKSPHPDIMFAMLDGKEYSDLIWRKLKPGCQTFCCDADS